MRSFNPLNFISQLLQNRLMLAPEVPVLSAGAVIVAVRIRSATHNVLADRVLARYEVRPHEYDFRNNGRHHKILLFRY